MTLSLAAGKFADVPSCLLLSYERNDTNSSTEMLKIAFVNQPFDTILPPFQSSVGACTYGVLPYLEQCCKLVIYGLEDANRDRGTNGFGRNVSFRFFPSTQADRLIKLLRTKSSKLVQLYSTMTPPNRRFQTAVSGA